MYNDFVCVWSTKKWELASHKATPVACCKRTGGGKILNFSIDIFLATLMKRLKPCVKGGHRVSLPNSIADKHPDTILLAHWVCDTALSHHWRAERQYSKRDQGHHDAFVERIFAARFFDIC